MSNLIRPRCAERAKRGRGKPVLIMHIGFLACFHTISLERSRFSKIASFFRALVALKMLVSLISRLVGCSPRIVVDRQTDRQTDRHTERRDYCNPRWACAPPRVNNYGPSNQPAMHAPCTMRQQLRVRRGFALLHYTNNLIS